MTLATLQAQRDALATAMNQGILTVRSSDGDSITYQSTADMLRALNWIDKEIAALSGGSSRRGRFIDSGA